MQAKVEQVLDKAHADAKIQSSMPGTYGTFRVEWDVKDGHPIGTARVITEKSYAFPKE